MKSVRHFITGKVILALLAFGAFAFVAESCGQKKACGTKHQKKKRHKRIKKNTTFMSGFTNNK
jgi:hypothetical protein